jgi:hypothetical protein
VALTNPATIVVSVEELVLDGVDPSDPMVERAILAACRPELEGRGLSAEAAAISAAAASAVQAEAGR